MMQSGADPRLSVIVVSFNGERSLQACLESLERQTVREGLEVLVVLAWRDADGDEQAERAGSLSLPDRFAGFRWVRAPRESTVPQMRGLGLVLSKGGLVAFLEDDCIAPPTWCERMLESHVGTHGAVGGAVEPRRLATSLDWAVYLSEYGPFVRPSPADDSPILPGTNVSYKRLALAGLLGDGHREARGDGFYEVFVHRALRRKGWRLKMDPGLVVYNAHAWTPVSAMKSRFHHGRAFAGKRLTGSRWWRRVPYLGLAVVLPIVQVARLTRRVLAGKSYLPQLAGAMPWVILCSISWSVGEFTGYLLGPGDSPSRWS